MLLESVLEFKKENCFPVAIKFDIEISTVLKNAKRSNSVTSILVSPSQKKARERRRKLVEADQKQEDKKL